MEKTPTPKPPAPTPLPIPEPAVAIVPGASARNGKVSSTAMLGVTPTSSRYTSLGCIAERFGVDILAAATAAGMVAPLITVIDRGIMENASGKRKLAESIKAGLGEIVRKPHRFLASKPFGLIFMLYSGTYITANSIDTLSSLRAETTAAIAQTTKPHDIKTVTAGTPKFLATTSVNMSLCLYKDRTFTRLFSTITPRPVPLPTYFLFSARDTMTILFSFNIPPLIAPLLPINPNTGMVAGWEKVGWNGWKPQTVTQIVAPAVCQVFSTPLHLLGLDLYNKPGEAGGGGAGRWGRIRNEWFKSAVARMGRIVPAFGIGGVVNAGVRRWGLEKVEERW